MRPIDADALMQDVIAHSYPLTNAFAVGGVDDGMFTNGFQQVVDEQPTIDAVPVVHGEWIKTDDNICYARICSVCRKHVRVCIGLRCHDCDTEANYCPNCGAKMDGEQ